MNLFKFFVENNVWRKDGAKFQGVKLSLNFYTNDFYKKTFIKLWNNAL